MAYGPIYPSSAYIADTAGRIYPAYYAGGGGNASAHDEGYAVIASLDADATLELRFPMPPAIPTGTLKLDIRLLTSDTGNHNAKLTVSDAAVAVGASPSAATLTAESQTTINPNNEADKIKQAKVTLSATPAAGNVLVVACKFQTSGWTISGVSVFSFGVIWE